MNAKSLAAAAGVFAVIISLFGFLWSIKQDIVGIHRDMAGLRERMARIEVIIERFTGQATLVAGSSIAKDLSKADLREPD